MSTVNAPLRTVHWATGEYLDEALCGNNLLKLPTGGNLTEDCEVVSCIDCCWRLVAVLHKQQAQILATLMKSAAGTTARQ